MGLSGELVQQIQEAAASQEIDGAEIIHSIAALIGDSECVDYAVWAGPGWQQDELRFDLYVLGESCLYNYSVFTSGSGGGVIFLDGIETIYLVQVQHAKSPYVLTYGSHSPEEAGMIFGGPDDRGRLERMQQNLVSACWRAKGSRGGK